MIGGIAGLNTTLTTCKIPHRAVLGGIFASPSATVIHKSISVGGGAIVDPGNTGGVSNGRYAVFIAINDFLCAADMHAATGAKIIVGIQISAIGDIIKIDKANRG